MAQGARAVRRQNRRMRQMIHDLPGTPSSTETRIDAPYLRSLVWDGDTLVDWLSGGERWTLQGDHTESNRRFAFSFDMVATLPGSGYSLIYKRLGTKGLLLKDGQHLREINRAYYHAEDYEYPVVLFHLPSGRPAIAHCPDDYCRLRIDDLETGAVITSATDKASDFFHSRLSVSPDGRWLASAGWMWHPVDDVALYGIEAALADGSTLDTVSRDLDVLTDRGNAAGFDRRSRLLVATDMTGFGDEAAGKSDGPRLLRFAPGVDPAPDVRAIELDSVFMAVGDNHLLLLGGMPRLLAIDTGQIVAEWPGIPTIIPSSAVQSERDDYTAYACDVENARIAIAHDEGITVIAFDIPPTAST